MIAELEKQCNYGEAIVDMKGLLMKACSNIFSKYFCCSERKSFRDPDHNKYCEEFDKWETYLNFDIFEVKLNVPGFSGRLTLAGPVTSSPGCCRRLGSTRAT